MRRGLCTRDAAAAAVSAALAVGARARELNPSEARAYNYLIALGCLALVAIYVPLTVLQRSRARTACYIGALAAALVSVAASLAGAALGGPKWQTLPTAAFMALVAGVVGLRAVGGRRLLEKRKGASNLELVSVASVDASGRWVPETPRATSADMVSAAGVRSDHLRAGGQVDRDAAAVSVIGWRSLWKPTDADRGECMHATVTAEPYEPAGHAILASVATKDSWMPPLIGALSQSEGSRRMHALIHAVLIGLWWLGMGLGALAKTGLMPVAGTVDVAWGNDTLRTFAIWLQTLLLIFAVFSFPLTRSVVRFEASKVVHALAVSESVLSLGMGGAALVWGREAEANGNLVAYAASLMVAATAAAVWSVIAVFAYVIAVRRIVAGWTEGRGDARVLAYLAAVVTRPRYGYVRGRPALLWGRPGKDGKAPLAAVVDAPGSGAISEDFQEDAAEKNPEAGTEWAQLEAAVQKTKWWERRPRVET